MPWLDVLARSGMMTFVSVSPDAVGPEQEDDLRIALPEAAEPRPLAKALDWQATLLPSHWEQGSSSKKYDWVGEEGVSPFSKVT